MFSGNKLVLYEIRSFGIHEIWIFFLAANNQTCVLFRFVLILATDITTINDIK